MMISYVQHVNIDQLGQRRPPQKSVLLRKLYDTVVNHKCNMNYVVKVYIIYYVVLFCAIVYLTVYQLLIVAK